MPHRDRSAVWAFAAFVAILMVVQAATSFIDPPAALLTWSADLLTDQGFQTKAAQLWVKFGHWSLPYNMDFRPASPLYTLIMGVVFRIFGVHLATLAGYSLAVSASTLLVGHAIARRIFGPWQAAAVTAAFALCFTNFWFSRLALIEPTAILLALLAILFYARGSSVGNLCASLGFAAASFMTKVHFVSILAALTVAWLVDLQRLRAREQRPVRYHVAALGAMLLLAFGSAAWFVHAFAGPVADFAATVSKSIAGSFGPRRLLVPFKVIGPEMTYATRLPTMMLLLLLGAAVFLWRDRGRIRSPQFLLDALWTQPRAVVALELWTLSGIAVVCSLNYRPSRYMLFLDFPLIVLGAYSAMRIGNRRRGAALAAALAAMFLYQAPLYGRWLMIRDKFSKQDAYAAVARRIDGASHAAIIPVVGQEAAELGLRSKRIMPLEIDFVPAAHYSLCQRLAYWKPRFYVRLENDAASEQAALSSCPQIASTQERARFRVLGGYKGALVLYRLRWEAASPAAGSGGGRRPG